MPYYKFKPNDTFYNRIETHPQADFFLWDGKTYYNNNPEFSGTLSDSKENHVPVGYISLYELNVDRPSDNLIYPFVTKEGSLTAFKTVSLKSFNADFQYGDVIKGSYPLSASISRDYLDGGTSDAVGTTVYKRHLFALKNTLDYYKYLSHNYEYNSPSDYWDKGRQDMSFISIPSIFYGSSIEKGSISLKFYVTGTLAAEVQDINRNGDLIEVTGSSVGSVAGVALYNEGFLLLTGSWDISSHQEDYVVGGGDVNAKWIYFAATGTYPTHNVPSSSFGMSFRGTNYVPVKTILAHAPKGYLNHSNNPTYIKYGQSGSVLNPSVSEKNYIENRRINIKNTVSSSYADPTGSFEKQTWISKIGIFDKDKNLIGIAKIANPVKKTEDREFTFKLKVDF